MKDEMTAEPTPPVEELQSELVDVLPKESQQEHLEKVEAIHHWIDDVFSREQERLSHDGVSDPKVWVEGMAAIDKALALHPLETLEYLARVYGVTFPQKVEPDFKLPPEVVGCLQQLAQNQQNLWQALRQQGEQTKQLAISNFVSAKDDDGNLLHPYFMVVKDEMFALLNSGVAADFETAYDKALWLNAQTRAELLQKQSSQNLQHLADEAQKAKSAGFSPRGQQGKEDYSQMTTREILEQKFRELED